MTKSAFVAIVGKPNVGKSSLLNALIGEKVAIVSNKPQTTRTKITGVLTRDETQFVFIDTPGFHKPKTKLSEYMNEQVSQSIADVDITVMVIEPVGELRTAEKDLLNNLKTAQMPAILAVNKVDTLQNKDDMLGKIAKVTAEYTFDAVVPISATTGDGIDRLMGELDRYAQEGPHFFPDDALTDQPERVIAAEIIREKILNNMRDEVPHGIAVTIEKMKEREDGKMIDIEAIIYCERDSHKGMIIGKGGAMLKKIGSQARVEIESFLDIKINLQCWVKVKEDWRNKAGVMRNFGFN